MSDFEANIQHVLAPPHVPRVESGSNPEISFNEWPTEDLERMLRHLDPEGPRSRVTRAFFRILELSGIAQVSIAATEQFVDHNTSEVVSTLYGSGAITFGLGVFALWAVKHQQVHHEHPQRMAISQELYGRTEARYEKLTVDSLQEPQTSDNA